MNDKEFFNRKFDVKYFKIQRTNDYIIFRDGGRVSIINGTSLYFFFNYPFIKIIGKKQNIYVTKEHDHFINSFDYEVSEDAIELKSIQCISPANDYEINFYCFTLAKQAFGGFPNRTIIPKIVIKTAHMLLADTVNGKTIQVLACSKGLPIEDKDIIGAYNKSLDGNSDFTLLSTYLIELISSVSTEDSPFQIDDMEKAIINSCPLPGTISQLICNNIMHDLIVIQNEDTFKPDKEGFIYSTDKYTSTFDFVKEPSMKEANIKKVCIGRMQEELDRLDKRQIEDPTSTIFDNNDVENSCKYNEYPRFKKGIDMPKKQLSKEELDKIDSLSLKDNIDFSAIICHNADGSNRALRYNEGKPRWGLIDYKSLLPLIRVLEYGANKYSVDNWKKGLDKREILESMQRHLASMMDGEENDKESGLPHIGHIMANAMFYSYFMEDKNKK